ncbi:MAG: hypothetical protein AAGG69_06725 [Pseudomonadota bacterium]
MLAALSFPQVLSAEGFTGTEFLTWSETAQAAFFQNSVLMASTISSRLEETHATCVSDWYFGEAVDRGARNQEVLETIRQYPEFHPSAVVLAVIERECGQYGRD